MIFGTVASAGLAIVAATRIVAAELNGFFRLGTFGSSGYDIAWSLALLGAGHLVGLSVGMAMLAGLIIAWGVAVPILTHLQPTPRHGNGGAHVDGLAHAGSLHRRRGDRCVRDLDAGDVGQAGGRRTREHDRFVSQATGDDLDRDLSPHGSWR